MFPTSFPDKEVISTITAKMLIEVEAVRFSSGEPFKFTSGWASPVYIDCRKLISYPRVRHTLMDFAASVILETLVLKILILLLEEKQLGYPLLRG
jgi:orotate phosphoribosyltransferase